jgi:hypothetical protein
MITPNTSSTPDGGYERITGLQSEDARLFPLRLNHQNNEVVAAGQRPGARGL